MKRKVESKSVSSPSMPPDIPSPSDVDTLCAMLRKTNFDELLATGALLTVKAAARRIGYSEWGLRLRCRRGEVKFFRRGKSLFFLPSQLNDVFKLGGTV